MADKFDWKKVLKTPFSRQEDRSAEVLFLPTEAAGRPTASFDTLSSRTTPQPGVAPDPEPPVEYQPPAPLVLPPENKLSAWGEDAFAPTELQAMQVAHVEVAGAIPPVLDTPAPISTPEPTPEELTPIHVSNWQTPAVAMPQYAPAPIEPEHTEPAAPEPIEPIESLPAVEPVPVVEYAPEIEAAEPEPEPIVAHQEPETEPEAEREANSASSLAASTQQTDDLLARFGVQRAAPKPQAAAPAEAASPELLGDLERLLAGMGSDAKPAEAAAPTVSGEAQNLVPTPHIEVHVPEAPVAKPSDDLESLLQSLQPTSAPVEDTPVEIPEITALQQHATTHEEAAPVSEELRRAEPDFKWAELVAKESVPDDSDQREMPLWNLAAEAAEPSAHHIEAEIPHEMNPEEEAPAEEPTVAEALPDEHAHFDLASMLTRAAANRGTDFVRVGPIGDTCPVWFRTAGYFEHVHDFSAEEGRGIWSWFITHANAVASDDQPGRFSFGENTKVSVGFARDGHGEMLVAHIGKARSGPQELSEIGLSAAEEKAIASAAASMHGLIVVSAPAGQSVRPMIEGVVACWNKAGRQTAWLGLPPQDLTANVLSAQAGNNPADALAGLMAAESECLAIDELSSSDLADLASHAVIQGRLVCVGVTAADGWSALARLTEFGVSPYLMSSAVRGIVSCRSVRALCPECKCSQPLDEEKKAKLLAVTPDALMGKIWTAMGCEHCHGTGYQGFTTLFEVVKVDEEASRLIALRSGPASFRAHFARAGQKSMAQAAIQAVMAGRTSWEEVEGFLGV